MLSFLRDDEGSATLIQIRLELTGLMQVSEALQLDVARRKQGATRPNGCPSRTRNEDHLVIQVGGDAWPCRWRYTDVCAERPVHIVIKSAKPWAQCWEAVKNPLKQPQKLVQLLSGNQAMTEALANLRLQLVALFLRQCVASSPQIELPTDPCDDWTRLKFFPTKWDAKA